MQTRLLQSGPITSTENQHKGRQKKKKKKKGNHVLFNKPSPIPNHSSKKTSLDSWPDGPECRIDRQVLHQEQGAWH